MEEVGDKEKRGLSYSILRFFWEVSPFFKSKNNSMAYFLRSLSVFENFSDNELRILSSYLHNRYYNKNEIIFRQNDLGVGFYIINQGRVNVLFNEDCSESNLDCHSKDSWNSGEIVLEKGDYFGELALLQENGARSASVVARDATSLLVFYKPDLAELIDEYPAVAAKLLQSLASIVASRLYLLGNEIAKLQKV